MPRYRRMIRATAIAIANLILYGAIILVGPLCFGGFD